MKGGYWKEKTVGKEGIPDLCEEKRGREARTELRTSTYRYKFHSSKRYQTTSARVKKKTCHETTGPDCGKERRSVLLEACASRVPAVSPSRQGIWAKKKDRGCAKTRVADAPGRFASAPWENGSLDAVASSWLLSGALSREEGVKLDAEKNVDLRSCLMALLPLTPTHRTTSKTVGRQRATQEILDHRKGWGKRAEFARPRKNQNPFKPQPRLLSDAQCKNPAKSSKKGSFESRPQVRGRDRLLYDESKEVKQEKKKKGKDQ